MTHQIIVSDMVSDLVSNNNIQIDTEVKVIEESLNINEETGLISPTDILTQGNNYSYYDVITIRNQL